MWFDNTITIHKPPHPLSFEEFLAYDESGLRYNLLDTGELVELWPENHIDVVQGMALFHYLRQFLDWRFFRLHVLALEVTPTTVKLPDGQIRHIHYRSRFPDLVVLSEKAAQQMRDGYYCTLSLAQSSPLLIVECVDESNYDEAYIDRRAQYEARGVREYWIADRHQQKVTVLTMVGDRYEEATCQGSAAIQSKVFPDAEITAEQVLHIDEL